MTPEQRYLDALAQHIREAGVTQRQLSDALKTAGMKAGKDTISLWVRGEQVMKPAEVFAVERALALPPGELSRHLGYVPAGDRVATVPEAIDADPELGPIGRRTLTTLYVSLRGQG